MRQAVRTVWFAALAAICGCSGGGGSAAAPRPNPPIPGAGTPAVFDQKITFTIDVPAAPSAATASLRRGRPAHVSGAPAASATPIATTPYVSANTGSVLLTLAEVNNVSPQQAPPAIAPVDVPPACQGSAGGCVIPVSGVPAATGVDRYFVQTYSGPNATGSIISTGFVDVTVPLKPHANPSIGGTAALSIGGFVATIALAPAQLSFVQGTPADASVLVQALDAGGATIVGAAVYATPITVTVADSQNFTLNGAASVTVPGPLKSPLALHYGGGSSFGTLVQATSLNGGGTTVNAIPIAADVLPPGSSPTPVPSIGVGPATPTPVPSLSPIPTTIPSALPTPVPTPVPTPTIRPAQAMSLYVADGQADTISEYRIASQIAAGAIPDPDATPSRVFAFDPSTAKSAAIGSAGLSCAANSGTVTGAGNGTAGVTVDPNTGNVFVFPNCNDGVNGFVFGYPPQAVGTPAPTIYDPFNPSFGVPNGLAQVSGTLFAAYTSSNEAVYGFPFTGNGRQPPISFGANCYTDYANPPGCFASSYAGIGVDSRGFAYVPTTWNSTPTGDAAAFLSPGAVLALNSGFSNGATVTPFSALAGLNANVGGSAPLAATVDGSMLYLLTGSNPLTSADGTSYWPGVSSCPPPGANAPINTIDPGGQGTPNCVGGMQHLYLAAYSLTGQLLGPGANGQDIDLVPNLILGGDTVGRFGCQIFSFGGQFLAASGGFVYVINLYPTCTTADATLSPEIDVYNTNGLTGAFTNQAPVFRLPLTSGFPLAVALGPSGTVVGGQALLRRPLHGPFRPNLYGRHVLRRPHLLRSSIRLQ